MDAAKDALGQSLTVGDHVAHISRYGVVRRRIAAIRARLGRYGYGDWEVQLAALPTQQRSPWGRAQNLIKIAPETNQQ